MMIIVVAVLSCVVGLGAAIIALVRLVQFKKVCGIRWFSLRALAALGVLVAGCLLAAGGQDKLIRHLHQRSFQAEAESRLQTALAKPLDAIVLRIRGPDPFHDLSGSDSLRLRFTTKAGPGFVSRIARSQMAMLRSATANVAEYLLAWPSIVEGTTSAEDRSLAVRLGRPRYWFRLDRIEAETLVASAENVSIPDALEILLHEKQSLPVFQGTKASEQLLREGSTWVSTYRDPSSPVERMDDWRDAWVPPPKNVPFLSVASLVIGLFLVIAGIRLLFLGGDAGTEERAGTELSGLAFRQTPNTRFWARPWFWLTLQAALLFVAVSSVEMAPEGQEERQRAFFAYGDGYLRNRLASEVSWSSFVDSLTSNRTFGFPLLLKFTRTLTPSFSAWPFCQLGGRVLAVFVFCFGLRCMGVSGWLATALSSSLFYSELCFWSEDHCRWIVPDPTAESLALLTIGMLLVVVGRPCRILAWSGLTLSLFLTYQTHPSYLFLIALLPPLGVVLFGLVSARAEWIRRRWRVGVGLVAAGVLPYLAWCTLRWVLVGHFGLVSVGGFAAVAIPGLWLTDDLVQELPEDLRPLAVELLRERAKLPQWKPPLDSDGRFHIDAEFVADKRRFDTLTWPTVDLFVDSAKKVYGIEPYDVNGGFRREWAQVDRKLSRMALALIKARPRYYAAWLAAASRVAIRNGIIGQLLKYLLALLFLFVVIWHIVWVIQRLRLGPALAEGHPGRSGSYSLELHVMILIAVSFMLARVLQVILVAPPEDRHMNSAGVLLPTIAVVALFAVGRQICLLLAAQGAKDFAAFGVAASEKR